MSRGNRLQPIRSKCALRCCAEGCFIEGLLVINERVELSAVLKVISRVAAGLAVRETDLRFSSAEAM